MASKAAEFTPQKCNGCWQFKSEVLKLQCDHTLCMNCLLAQEHINGKTFFCQVQGCNAEYGACEYSEEEIGHEYFIVPRHVDGELLFEHMCAGSFEMISNYYHRYCTFMREQSRVYVEHLENEVLQAQQDNQDLVSHAKARLMQKDDIIVKLKRNLYKMQLALQNAAKENEINKMDVNQFKIEKSKNKSRSNEKIGEKIKQKMKDKMKEKRKEKSNDNSSSNDSGSNDSGSSTNGSSFRNFPKLQRSFVARPKSINPKQYLQQSRNAAVLSSKVGVGVGVGGSIFSKKNSNLMVNSGTEIDDIDIDSLLNCNESDEPPKKKRKVESNEKTKDNVIILD